MDSLLYKYIIVGNSATGKSCLLCRYTQNQFEFTHDMTIGVEFGSKEVMCNGHNIKLQIWDTAGQESFRSLISAYYRGAIGGLIVFDITNRKSFDNIKSWITEVTAKCYSPITLILIGNKSDLANNRSVSYAEAAELAKEHHMTYIETSSKTNYNVIEAFENLTKEITQKIKNKSIDKSFIVDQMHKTKFPEPIDKKCMCI